MAKLTEKFDASKYLETREDVAIYLTEAFATEDHDFIMSCIEDVVKSRVVSEVATKAGVHRVSLHKMLAQRSNARLSSISNILAALDCQLAVIPKVTASVAKTKAVIEERLAKHPQHLRGFTTMATKKRDPAVVERFLKKEGLTKIPKGKEVDHKRPLVDGGSDTVRNMQLLTEKQHATKTAREAKARANRKSR